MKDVGAEFTDFLKAYGSDDYYKLGNPSITEADIDAIFARHQANFDAWRRIPAEFKDAYGRAAPYMLEKAKTDPNFTENDARKAREEHHQNINPYSPVPKDLEAHPIYQSLIDRDIRITPAHIAAMALVANEFRKHGYSNSASEKISYESGLRKILHTERQKVLEDKTLTDSEKQKQLGIIDRQIDQTLLAEDKTKKNDAAINQPERMLIHMLRDTKRGKISTEDAAIQADLYIKQIIALNRMILLEKEMDGSLYQKVLRDEQRQILAAALANNNSDFQIEQTQLSAPAKDKPQTKLELDLIAMRNRAYQRR